MSFVGILLENTPNNLLQMFTNILQRRIYLVRLMFFIILWALLFKDQYIIDQFWNQKLRTRGSNEIFRIVGVSEATGRFWILKSCNKMCREVSVILEFNFPFIK